VELPAGGGQQLAEAAVAAAQENGLPFEVYGVTNGGVTLGVGAKAATPAWYMLTDANGGRYELDKRRLASVLAGRSDLKNAKVAVLMTVLSADGRGEPVIDFSPAALAKWRSPGFDLTTLASAIQGQFVSAGLTVVDAGVLAAARNRMAARNQQFRQQAQIVAALEGMPALNVVCLGLAEPVAPAANGGGGVRMHFKLVDVRNGSFIGSASYPDAAATANVKYPVAQAPEGVGRFVAGTLLDAISRQGGKPSEMDVFVKGATCVDEVVLMSTAFGNDPAVVSADGFAFEYGVGSFRMKYKGDFGALLRRINADARSLPFALVTDLANAGVLELQVKPPGDRKPEWVLNVKPPAGGGGGATRPVDPAAPPAVPHGLVPVNARSNWAVVIGVNGYPGGNALKLAVNDARNITDTLTKFCGYPKDHVMLLADGVPGATSPTRQNIIDAVASVAGRAAADDTILFYFSGHGMSAPLVGRDGRPIPDAGGHPIVQSMILPIDVELGAVAQSSVSVTDVRLALKTSRAKNRIVVLDSCHSGSDVDAPFRSPFEGITRDEAGTVTLAGCRVNESCLEWPPSNSGLFSKWLTKGIAGEAAAVDRATGEMVVEVDTLYHYLFDMVPREAATTPDKAGKPNQQHPFILQSKSGNIILSRFKPAAAGAAAGAGR
jgi:hypothetical protein